MSATARVTARLSRRETASLAMAPAPTRASRTSGIIHHRSSAASARVSFGARAASRSAAGQLATRKASLASAAWGAKLGSMRASLSKVETAAEYSPRSSARFAAFSRTAGLRGSISTASP